MVPLNNLHYYGKMTLVMTTSWINVKRVGNKEKEELRDVYSESITSR